MREVGGGITTARCELQGTNVEAAAGMGKGLGVQRDASAIFEAIEHLWWFSEDVASFPRVRLNLQEHDSNLSSASPDLSRLANSPLTRAVFSLYSGQEDDLYLPYILTNPFFCSPDEDERTLIRMHQLQRYGSNSGTAAGLTRQDAILHAALENIERDAISLELLRTVMAKRPAPVRRYWLSDLSSGIQEIVHRLERAGAEIAVWDITSDVGVPVALAALRGPNGYRYFGSGASLSADYAIERAVLEAVQGSHVAEIGGVSHATTGNLGTNPLPMARCYLDGGYFGYRGGEIRAPLSGSNMSLSLEPLSIEEQINVIVSRMSARGLKLYVRDIIAEEVCVVQVVTPELDRFHLVTTGVPVVPSSRGREAMSGTFEVAHRSPSASL